MNKFYSVSQDGDQPFNFYFFDFEKAQALYMDLMSRYPRVTLTTLITSDDRDPKDIMRDLALDWLFKA